MSKIGFFGGSFNPPTLAHFEIIKNALKEFNLDKIVVVPMGDKYQKNGLISFEHRYNMLFKMFENDNSVEISRMQANQEKISYAVDCFREIDEKYKSHERFFIMGLDNFAKIETWKDGKKLVDNRNFIVFERNDYDFQNRFSNNVKFVKVNNDTSSSLVRQKIKTKGNYEEMVLPEVASYINQKGLYK